MLALAAVALGLWLLRDRVWLPGRGFVERPVAVVSGDEPHYLLLVHSLLQDRDLELAADYDAVAAGAPRAGAAFAGVPLDHHTWVVDPASGARALWSELYDWRRPSRCDGHDPGCRVYRKLDERLPEASPTRRERPAHPPAYALAVAACLAPLGLDAAADAGAVERAAIATSWLFVLATLVATWLLAGAAGLPPASRLAAAALVLLSPLTAYARGLFAEPLTALLLTLGLWAWLRARPATAATLLAGAAWLKPPWALLGLALWAMAPRRGDATSARRFGLPFAAAGAALLLGNLALTGGPIVSGQLGWTWAEGPLGWARTWIDGRHGLLPFVPWVVLALPALRPRPPRAPSLADVAPGLVALGLLLSAFGSLGEICVGPRLWLPLLPLLAVAALVVAAEAEGPRRSIWRRWLWLCGGWAALAAAPGVLSWPAAWEQPAYALLQLTLRRWAG